MTTTKQASLNENIITGLKLSEAIKLLEENEGALLRPDNVPNMTTFCELSGWHTNLKRTYSVKLPPPKSVTVTKSQLAKAWHIPENTVDETFEEFCKELGL